MGYYDSVELITFPIQQDYSMATHSVVHQVFADTLRNAHDKMVAKVMGMFGFEERHFTPEEYQLLRAFDTAPLAAILVSAAQRKLNKKKPNAST